MVCGLWRTAGRPVFRVLLVAPARFERTTCPLGGDRSIQLSYGALAVIFA